MEIENEKEKSVLSIHNLQQHSAVFTRLILNKGKVKVGLGVFLIKEKELSRAGRILNEGKGIE